MDPLGDEVKRELRSLGPQAGSASSVDAWPAAVGPEIARNAWPSRFLRDGTLIVHTRDAVWAFELDAARRRDRVATAEHAGAEVRAGTARRARRGRRRSEPPPASEATPEQALDAARWAAAIEDEELRELVARAARASLARAAADRPF